MKIKLLILFILASYLPIVNADEGMWIPMLLKKNEADMQKQGMKITAEDIYNINTACLKDAVLLFNQGCTAEFVSDQGLFLTNHHCGYYYITSNSTVEHDYLTNGFWAMKREEEIPCKGLTVTRLVRMEDVTSKVLEGVDCSQSEQERNKIIETNIKKISETAVSATHYKAVIKPFYYGNQYFMYINEIFKDVRLVGAPPSNIGKFGGDTDNWMWPRHTGDFSMFRVYVDKDGKPAEYSKDNLPYKPLKHLEISLKGVEEDDFTFVFGYPGTTRRYVTSDAVNLSANILNPVRIGLRNIRLKYYNTAMNQDAAQRLKYASRLASIANGWKKWQGETQGIQRLKGIEQKKTFEKEYQKWANNNDMYKNILPQLSDNYAKLKDLELEFTYFNEAVMASDFMNRAYEIWKLSNTANENDIKKNVENLIRNNENYFKDFEKHTIVDKGIFIETFMYMWKAGYCPYIGENEIEAESYLRKVYAKSMLNSKDKIINFLKTYNPGKSKKITRDPAVALFNNAYNTNYNQEKFQEYKKTSNEINRLMRIYVKGLMEMQPDVNFFPDANLTLRVAYGHVQGFHPKDGVYYKEYSTLNGIMQKENPNIYDYVVENKLKELYKNKDYGVYANKNGELPVGFIATNHTTGGNSGSPVLNADGQLIGINFDRCWEGTMSDLLFDPDYCRNISLDIRYCLFIIDKFANAKHLINEMTIVK